MQVSQKNQLTFAKEVLLNIRLLQHAPLKQANHRKRTFHALCELFNSATTRERKGLFCHGSVLTVNAQEQREVGVLALSPLGDNAVDRLQVLQAAGQLPVQLLGQVGCVSRQGLGCQLGLAELLLQRQVLLDQLLVLHGQLDTRTRPVSGHSGHSCHTECPCPVMGARRAGAALPPALQAVVRGENVPPTREVPRGTALSLPRPAQQRTPALAMPCLEGCAWALPGPSAKAGLGLPFCCPQLESSAFSIPSIPMELPRHSLSPAFQQGTAPSTALTGQLTSRKQERLSC